MLLFVFRILIVFSLSNYFDLIDENRVTMTHMISSILYEETFSFPIELICIELGYLMASIAFEVSSCFDLILPIFLIEHYCRVSV